AHPLFLDGHGYEVREVIFALLVKLDHIEVGPQPLRVEQGDAAVDLRNGALYQGGGALFDYAEQTALLVSQHSPRAAWIVSGTCEHCEKSARRPVSGD